MPIHIGRLIEKKAKEEKYSLEALGSKINKTRQTVGDIYKRQSIDTELLILICKALEYDFLEVYYSEEPLKSLREKQLEPFKKEVEELKTQLSIKNQRIKDLERTLESDRLLIQLLNEEMARYRKG